jgi:hypothetical protein
MVTSWADSEKDRLNRIYGEGWSCWYIYHQPKSYSWHARPAGARIATIHADSPGDLERQIKDQQGKDRTNGAGPEACQCGD